MGQKKPKPKREPLVTVHDKDFNVLFGPAPWAQIQREMYAAWAKEIESNG